MPLDTPVSSRTPRGFLASPVFWILVIAFTVRLIALNELSASPYFLPEKSDMKFYNDWALRIAKGEWTTGQAFYGLPGYAYLLGIIYSVAGHDPYLIGLLQALCDSATAVVIYKICRHILRAGFTESRHWLTTDFPGLLGAAAWIFCLPAQAYSVILMPTAWMICAFWWLVYWVISTRSQSAWKPWLFMGLAAGLVANMIATILFLVPLIAAGALWRLGSVRPLKSQLWKMGAAFFCMIVGVFLGAAPCWMHNYFIAGEPVLFSAHSGINFWIGNNPEASGYPRIPQGIRASQEGLLLDSISLAEKAEGRPLKRAEVSKYWSDKADNYIRSHPTEWLKLMAVKFRNFWNAFQYDDISTISLLRQEGIIPGGLRYGVISAFGIAAMFFIGWKHRASRWVIAAILLHMLALLPVFVTERYRLAAVPGLIILAAIFIYEFWRALVEQKWLITAGSAAAVVASALFVSWPQSEPGLWSLDYYNTGIKALNGGNTDLAQKNLETAFSYVASNAETNFALGNLWMERGKMEEAKAFYRRTLELNPEHVSAWNNLGVIAIQQQQWEAAKAFLSEAAKLEPASAKVHYLLARTYLELHDKTSARQEIEQAIRFNPDQPEFQQLYEEIRR
jgi:tetratricopeptide (TPR) repeat protein